MTIEYRLQELEFGYTELKDRISEVERRLSAGDRAAVSARRADRDGERAQPASPKALAAQVASVPPPTPVASSRGEGTRGASASERRRRNGFSFEDLLGGRILALIGGFAILLAGAFFFALAVSNGWIGEAARTGLAAAGSSGLLALGIWLHERRGRTYASLSITGAALACLFLTVTVGAEVYHLIAPSTALGLALLVGAAGTLLAVRWRAVPIGAIGIVGALLSPVLAGAPTTAGTTALLFVAYAAAVAVLMWQRWDWLGFTCFLVAGPQWIDWLFESGSSFGSLLALLAFGALGAGAAIGFELRVPTARLRLSSAFLLTLNAVTLAVAGWFALTGDGGRALAELWLVFLALGHLGVGIAGSRLKRISEEISLLSLAIGIVLANIAFSLIVSGLALVIGWAAASVAFAWLLSRRPAGPLAQTLIGVGLGGHLVLAFAHVLALDAPPSALVGEPFELVTGVFALAVLSAALLISGRLAGAGHTQWRLALDSIGLAVLAYLAVLVFDGATLVAALAAESVALAWLSRRLDDELTAVASVAYLGAAMLHALAVEAPPQALVYGVDSVGAAALSLGACGFAALVCARQKLGKRSWQVTLWGAGTISLLYLGSVEVVTAFQPGGAETTVLNLPVRQQGQVLVSSLWGFVGLCALLGGLRWDLRELRIGALALLLATVAKVFLYDLSTLGSAYRVLSFLALGLLLLAASFAYQRLRPRPLPDLREVARALN